MNFHQISVLVLAVTLFAANIVSAQGLYGDRATRYNFGTYGPYITRPYVVAPYSGQGVVYTPLQRYGLNSQRIDPFYLPRTYSPTYVDPLVRYPVELYGGRNYDSTQRPADYSYQNALQWYRSYYSTDGGATAAPASSEAKRTTNVQVIAPAANAELWFNGIQTKQTGEIRQFVTPPLETGYTYRYQIRAVWNENGKRRELTRSVEIQPGKDMTLDLTKQ